MSLRALIQRPGGLGYKIVADPSTPLLAAYEAWKKMLAIERATVENGKH